MLIVALFLSLALLIATWTYNRSDIEYVLCLPPAMSFISKDMRSTHANGNTASQESEWSRSSGKGKTD
jgi:hypothetical protein